MKRFPKELLVKREEEGTKDEYLTCTETASDFAIAGDFVAAARYQLIENILIVAEIEIQKK